MPTRMSVLMPAHMPAHACTHACTHTSTYLHACTDAQATQQQPLSGGGGELDAARRDLSASRAEAAALRLALVDANREISEGMRAGDRIALELMYGT